MTTNTQPDPNLAPDPDEDDLDDLDDVLDSFAPKPAPKSSTTAPPPSSSGPGRPSTTDPAATSTSAIADDADPLDPSNPDLAKELQAGMADLISELGENKEMQSQFEAMMAELIAAGQAPTEAQAAEHVKSASESMPQMPASAREAVSGGKKEESFQETIRRTMERMQESDSTAKTASAAGSSAPGGDEERMLMELMKSLNAGGGAEGGGEEDFNTMLMSMMTQLTNKEILYEPMKELHEKYPAWLEAHAATEKKEDLERYTEQQRLVAEIVGRFERTGYSDENEEDREYIVERMQKMQAAGSPPSDLVGDTAAAQQALGDLDAGCPTQ